VSVTLADAKTECRVAGTSHDARITQYLASAIAWVENYTRKKLTATSAVSQVFAAFPGDPYAFALLWGPDPATVEVVYTDEAGDEQTITTARLVGDKVYPPLDTDWPDIEENSTITVEYTAGYTTTPDDLDMAVLLYVRELFDNGSISPQAEKAIDALCVPYRIPTLR
jgi:uncharacterized phiE125 gp8 family phage protein